MAIEEDALTLKATDLGRSESLFARQAISQTVLDGARAAHLGHSQKVLGVCGSLALLPTQREAQNEQIAVYRASLASADLNLARREITLPFAARVSLATVEQGQFVTAENIVARRQKGDSPLEAAVNGAGKVCSTCWPLLQPPPWCLARWLFARQSWRRAQGGAGGDAGWRVFYSASYFVLISSRWW